MGSESRTVPATEGNVDQYSRKGTIEKPDLQGAIPQINLIEENVARALRRTAEPSGAANFLRQLNRIQISLEEIASSAQLPGSGNEVR